ncbi:hypothetical protein ACS79_20330 [Vibrio lentus]|nr:hypothetical protein ACS79_20330 [Vibrio lentus]
MGETGVAVILKVYGADNTVSYISRPEGEGGGGSSETTELYNAWVFDVVPCVSDYLFEPGTSITASEVKIDKSTGRIIDESGRESVLSNESNPRHQIGKMRRFSN